MTYHRIGFWAAMVYMLVDLGQVHQMIPFVKYLRLGAISQIVLLAMVIPDAMRMNWFTPIAIFRLLFILSIALSMLAGFNMGLIKDMVIAETFRFVANFLGLIFFARRVEDLRIIYKLLVLLAPALSLYVMMHGGHGPGWLNDENDVGLVLVMLLPFSFLGTFIAPDKKWAFLYLAVFGLTLVGITATLSRGAMVGVLPTLFFIWLKSKRKVVSLIGVVLLGGMAVLFAPPKYLDEFRSIKNTDEGTAASRFRYWGHSIDLFLAKPITGVGANAWGHAIWSGLIEKPQKLKNSTPHSIYFQLLSELGTVGTVVWIGLLVSLIRALARLRRKRLDREANFLRTKALRSPLALSQIAANVNFIGTFATAIAISLVGYLVAGAFLSVLYYPEMMALSAYAQTAVLVWQRELLISQTLISKESKPAKPSEAKLPEMPGRAD